MRKNLDLSPQATRVSCLAGRTFLASDPGVPKSLGLPASALSLEPRFHGVPDLPAPLSSSSSESHAYPVRVLREPVHLLRPPRHGCSLREGERGRTRRGLVAAGLRAAGAPRTCDSSGPRESAAATAASRRERARVSSAKMSKLCSASSREVRRGKRSLTRQGQAKGRASPT